MKKGLLLSVVASGVIFAGGNIAPVQPVQQVAPAASDFYGSIAFRYDMNKNSASANSWGKRDNLFVVAVDLGIDKELGNGFGIGAEVGAFTHLGLTSIATRIPTSQLPAGTYNTGELSQLYLTYKAGNTAIKVGRQALPKNLSPWAMTTRTGGVADITYNGIVIVNTDIANTTLVGAWIASASDLSNTVKVDLANGSNKGLFMLAAEYTGVANTTFDFSAYYVPKYLGTNQKAYSFWASVKTKVNSVDLGLQATYSKASAQTKTFGIAGYIGTKVNNFDAKLTLAYIDDGQTALSLNPVLRGALGANAYQDVASAFWGATWREFGGMNSNNGSKQKVARLDLGYKLPSNYGKIYGGIAMDKFTGASSRTIKAARVGYNFTVAGVAANVEYMYMKDRTAVGQKEHRIRVQGVYKF